MKSTFLAALAILTWFGGVREANAAPKITEIRLSEWPAFVPSPPSTNQFVFRANGDFYWLEDTSNKPVRHVYHIDTTDWQKLTAFFDKSAFWTLQNSYALIPDAGGTTLSVRRGRQVKTVDASSGNGPQNLWELEVLTRGFASLYTGLNRTPIARLRDTPTPTSAPIPIIRGR